MSHYTTLGLEPTATAEQIKAAYRRLSFEWHPDKHSLSTAEKAKEAQDKFTAINEAHRILSNSTLKAAYDKPKKVVIKEEVVLNGIDKALGKIFWDK